MRLTPIALVLLAACPAGAQVLAGKVLEDHSGNPLASVELRVAKDGARQLTADLETDAGGRFQAEGIPPGDYRIEVSKPNYATLTLRIKLDAGGKTMSLRLVRFGAISGRVADPAGHTVPGAEITVMTKGPDGEMRPFGDFTTPDDRGQYRIHGLPPGEYAVAVSYGDAIGAGNGNQGRSSAGSGAVFYPSNQRPQWFTVAGGEDYTGADFLIVATALFHVSGVVQPAGKMYAVALTPVDQALLTVASKRLNSNNGAFQFDGIPPGSYDLYAAGPVMGYGFATAMLGPEPVFGKLRVDVGGQDVEGLTVPVERGHSASFLLRTASPQQPASACPAAATLTLTPLESTGARLDRTVEVNFEKAQTLDDLAPVDYRVAATKLGDSCAGATVILDPAREGGEPIVVTVAPMASLRGRLVTGAARPSDFVVVLAPSDPGDGTQPVQVAYPDAESRFVFAGLQPGKYHIGAQPAEASQARWIGDVARMTELELRGGGSMEIDLPAPVGVKNP